MNVKIHNFSVKLCVLSRTTVQLKCGVVFQHSWLYTLELAIHLSFLAFQRVRALFCELFHEIVNQSLHTSYNIADFIHLWFCEKLDEKLAVSSSLTFRENTDCLVRTAKREIRKMIGETVYEMPSTHFSFLLFRRHFFSFSSIWR